MANFTRKNAWDNHGTFSNSDLLWYAQGVRKMQSRNLADPASWWFFAALHNEYVTQTTFPGWAAIPPPPKASITPVPAPSIAAEYWNQCQHQSWFFLPWHRGYLLAIEAQLRDDIISLGGPATWALPYWSYLAKGQYPIPPAFVQQTLPDSSPNPLFVDARYGPDLDNNIYVPTPEAIALHPQDPHFTRGPVTGDSLQHAEFTGNGVDVGFGGPITGFCNTGDFGATGYIEANPHNLVHVYVGGIVNNNKYGLMADPGTAALDPIFYLHHANIDRLWAVWNGMAPADANPTTPNWLNGPTAAGDRKFIMPMPHGQSWSFTPNDVDGLAHLNYTYEELPVTRRLTSPLAARMTMLRAPMAATNKVLEGVNVTQAKNTELVGASPVSLALGRTGTSTAVRLDTGVRQKISASLESVRVLSAAPAVEPDRVFLKLENIRGGLGVGVLSVYVNLPEGSTPAQHPELLAGSAGLFGLRLATQPDGQHGGQGLSFVFEITKIVDQLHLAQNFSADSLHIQVIPDRPIADDSNITIGRISIYRQGQ